MKSNYEALEAFLADVDIAAYRHDDTRRAYRWWSGVPKAMIADLLDNFKAHSTDELFSQAAISKFVRTNGTGRFRTWDVVLVNGAPSSNEHEIGHVIFRPPSRTFIEGQSDELRLGGKSARLAGADDLTNVMSDEAVAVVRTEFARKEPKKAVPDSEYYPHLERPALLIYALRPAEAPDAGGSGSGRRLPSERRTPSAKPGSWLSRSNSHSPETHFETTAPTSST